MKQGRTSKAALVSGQRTVTFSVLFLAETMTRFLVVDFVDCPAVDRDTQFAVFEADDRVDRDFEIAVLAFVMDQDEVRVDVADFAEEIAVVGDHRRADWDAGGVMRVAH
jgi:hypothetical protein